MRNPVRIIAEPLERYLNRRDWGSQQFIKLYERPLEYGFALECINDTAPHHVLDVGAGKSPWPALIRTCGCMVTAVDQISGYWGRQGMHNRHYYVINDDITHPEKITGPFDMITCISVLEHIADHDRAIRSMFGLLRPGGYLVLTVPHSTEGYIDNVYALPEASYGRDFNYICQVFSPREVARWAEENDANVVRQDYFKVFSGRLWAFGERVYPYVRTSADELHQLTALLMRKRD